MKKNNIKKRFRSVRNYFNNLKIIKRNEISLRRREQQIRILNNSIEKRIRRGVNIKIDKAKRAIIYLPEKMNFSSEYDVTASYVNTIREFCKKQKRPDGCYRLIYVDFDQLRDISTSAALVLTAELSRWGGTINKQLKPRTKNWNPEILRKFKQLGFFKIFGINDHQLTNEKKSDSNINLVEYIRGIKGEREKARELGERLTRMLDLEISKWNFLHGGLTEAIVNVGHHAYPSSKLKKHEKAWFMGGAFNTSTKELKVTFYDQGIGIPKSLPTSDLWEKALEFLEALPIFERKKDEVMLKAAMELDRTRTGDDDRGKGLQDLLEFVKKREDGYLSILSAKGLYKYTVESGRAHVKTENFREPILGTLIIWRVILNAKC